jgi:hypothetical protein
VGGMGFVGSVLRLCECEAPTASSVARFENGRPAHSGGRDHRPGLRRRGDGSFPATTPRARDHDPARLGVCALHSCVASPLANHYQTRVICLASLPRSFHCSLQLTPKAVHSYANTEPGRRFLHLGCVWFRGYDLGDEDISNQLVRDSQFFCLVG